MSFNFFIGKTLLQRQTSYNIAQGVDIKEQNTQMY